MHLLDIRTYELQEFVEAQAPSYAILSHRWGEEELNFKEVSKRRIDQRKRGYRKLTEACRTAAGYDVGYLWIDTCCIDKKSSAELSEAINSMFSWYENAEICLAYLEDVKSGMELDESFRTSVWFTRSWTLQELLAPKRVTFFDGDWKYIGSKESRAEAIEAVTGIPGAALKGTCELWVFDICERMSWASDRHATRSEDIAYSLMGIFDIHMPLLYGEGRKAFTRLQEEIIRRANEPTILLWGLDNTTSNLLASSPADFRHAQRLDVSSLTTITPFSLTNIGLEIDATLIRYQLGTYGIVIGQTSSTIYAVLLRNVVWLDAFYRIGIGELTDQTLHWVRKEKIIILRGSRDQRLALDTGFGEDVGEVEYGFQVRTEHCFPLLPMPHSDQDARSVLETGARWNASNEFPGLICTFVEPTRPGVAKMRCRLSNSRTLWLDLSFDFNSRPCLLIRGHAGGIQSYEHLRKPSVWQLSDIFKSPVKIVSYLRGSWHEVELWDIIDGVPGPGSYFLRNSSGGNICAKLPPELAPLERPVWVCFIAPRSSENRSCSWVLAISSVEP